MLRIAANFQTHLPLSCHLSEQPKLQPHPTGYGKQAQKKAEAAGNPLSWALSRIKADRLSQYSQEAQTGTSLYPLCQNEVSLAIPSCSAQEGRHQHRSKQQGFAQYSCSKPAWKGQNKISAFAGKCYTEGKGGGENLGFQQVSELVSALPEPYVAQVSVCPSSPCSHLWGFSKESIFKSEARGTAIMQ